MRLALKDRVPVRLACLFFKVFEPTVDARSTLGLIDHRCGISLALGSYKTSAQAETQQKPPVDWLEGLAIVVAIFIVICGSQLSNLCVLTAVRIVYGWLP